MFLPLLVDWRPLGFGATVRAADRAVFRVSAAVFLRLPFCSLPFGFLPFSPLVFGFSAASPFAVHASPARLDLVLF